MHDCAPATEWYPAPHDTHAVDGSLSASASPAGHVVQFSADSGAYSPTAHESHAVDAFVSRSAVPFAHGAQLVCASDDAARPGWQTTHCVAGFESRSASPAVQCVHCVEPAAAYVPAPHAAAVPFPSHAVLASESWSTYPAGHCVHTVAPAAA